MGTLRPINPRTASLIVNPQAAAHDYDNLTHKPQINGHELSGDQSGSDLGLQNQLTAGDNVTIENGVISASGGVLVTVSSAAVNQDGTITFMLSDGTTLTTTGASVIGDKGDKGDKGEPGVDGSGYNGAAINSNGDLIVTEVTGAGTERTVNLGHVVGADGADGQDYVLTAQDKSDIADIVLSELPTTQGVLYGNTSN